jgi:MYXO-CTERM domain-containing protein
VAVGAGGATLKRALAYLRGLQRSNGSVSYSATSNQTPVWVTAQALMALERKPLPIAAVARQAKPKRKQKSKPAVAPAAPTKPKQDKPAESTGSAPAESGSDVETQSRLDDKPKSSTGALELDRAAGTKDDSGPSAWVFVAAALGVLGGLFALRRKLVPALWHSQRP